MIVNYNVYTADYIWYGGNWCKFHDDKFTGKSLDIEDTGYHDDYSDRLIIKALKQNGFLCWRYKYKVSRKFDSVEDNDFIEIQCEDDMPVLHLKDSKNDSVNA